jgi:hypothetical protein
MFAAVDLHLRQRRDHGGGGGSLACAPVARPDWDSNLNWHHNLAVYDSTLCGVHRISYMVSSPYRSSAPTSYRSKMRGQPWDGVGPQRESKSGTGGA